MSSHDTAETKEALDLHQQQHQQQPEQHAADASSSLEHKATADPDELMLLPLETLTLEDLVLDLGASLRSSDRQFLHSHAEQIARNLPLKQVYIDLILSTRTAAPYPTADEQLLTAASNAISILNYGGLVHLFPFRFDEVQDWSRIRVPYANLSHAQILNCNFNDSDLSHCIFFRSVLRNSSFCRANLANVTVDELQPKGRMGDFYLMRAVAFTPDGRYYASGGFDNIIRLWCAETAELVAKFPGVTSYVPSLSFTPDSKRLATTTLQNMVMIWDIESKNNVAEIDTGASFINAISFSPDGKLLAVTCDNTVRLLNTERNEWIATLAGHTNTVYGVSFSPDGRLLASGSGDNSVRVWNVESGECLETLKLHDAYVFDVCFSPDGRLLASSTGGANAAIQLWDANSLQCLQTFRIFPKRAACMSFTRDGKFVAACSGDNLIRIWDTESGACVEILSGHEAWVTGVSFSPDGKMLATASDDGTIRCRALKWSAICAPTAPGHTDQARRVSISPNGKLVASCSDDATIRIWDAESGRCRITLEGHQGPVLCVRFSPDGALLASGSHDSTIRLWSMESLTCTKILAAGDNEDAVRDLAFHPCGELLASASHVGRLWDLRSGECIATLGEVSPANRVAFSPDGTLLALGSKCVIQLYNTESGQITGVRKYYENEQVLALCFSPDGQSLAASYDSNSVILWSVSNPGKKLHCDASTRPTNGLCFSPDGKLLLAGTNAGVITVHDVATGNRIERTTGHFCRVTDICVNPSADGLYASCSGDGSIRIWSMGEDAKLCLRAVCGTSHGADYYACDFTESTLHPMLEKLIAWYSDAYSHMPDRVVVITK